MTAEESLELLQARWRAIEEVVKSYGGEPATDLTRDGLTVHVRVFSRERPTASGALERDLYVFRLWFQDYDDHAPRVWLCDPAEPTKLGIGRQFYPKIQDNNVFGHETFFCMPGDRRCYEQGNHPEWKRRDHYHPEVVIGSLFELLHAPGYQGRVEP